METPELPVIRIEASDATFAEQHKHSHHHVVHIYSTLDEHDHAFRVKDTTLISLVFEEFYQKTGTPDHERGVFRCESTGEDLAPFASETITQLHETGHSPQLLWIFARTDEVTIIVNTKKHEVHGHTASYETVVDFAYPVRPVPPKGQTVAFTITYRRGPHKNPTGTLDTDASVRIKNGMIFDVTPTITS